MLVPAHMANKLFKLIILYFSFWSLCQGTTVSAIIVNGNVVTDEEIIVQELGFALLDQIDQSHLVEARQNLQNLGLFRNVSVSMIENNVYVRVKEKRYFLALPEVRQVENTDFTFGGYIYLDNIAGQNQKIKLRYKAQELDEGLSKSVSLHYNNHRIGRSKFGLNINVSNSKEPLIDEVMQENKIDFSVSRWIKQVAPSRGWRMSGGFINRARKYSSLQGTRSDNSFTLTYNLEYLNVNNHIYSSSGQSLEFINEYGIDVLSSDYTYNKHQMIYQLFIPLRKTHQNYNFKFAMGYSSEAVFGEDAFDIGGRRGIRAYKDMPGNHYIYVRNEFLTPILKTRKSVRANLFADLGNAYDTESDIDLGDLKLSLGVGFNVKINYLVDMELRLENAYSVSDNSYRFYLFVSK